VPDTAAARLNFDGISYSKGAAVIKQLAAWVGGDSFESGLRRYIAEHAFGTTSLAGSPRGDGGRERALARFVGRRVAADGPASRRCGPTWRSGPMVAIPRQPSCRPRRPTNRRSGRSGSRSAFSSARAERLVRQDRLELDIEGARTAIPALVGRPAPHLLLLNDEDLTWAKVRLDERSLASVQGGAIPRIDEPLARALLWMTVLDMTRDAELSVADCLRVVLDGVAGEPDTGIAALNPVRSPRCG